ncbi:MAG: hypothetical protein IE923_07930 [Micrococcales bacterium]|nr:hypothetical protein [Micrococcales bacterium]
MLALLVTASTAGWYALARRIEARPSTWLRRILLGSAAASAYEHDDD